MSVDLSFFNANEVQQKQDWQALPEDHYEVSITESELKENKAKTGHFIELKLQVVSGKFKGNTLIDRLNIDNPNDKAKKIAEETLSSICHAIGVMTPKTSADLHNKKMIAKVVLKERDDKSGSYNNEVSNYYKIGTRDANQNADAVVPQSTAKEDAPAKSEEKPAATNGAKKKPWEK